MRHTSLDGLRAALGRVKPVHAVGRLSAVAGGVLHVTGLHRQARMGDLLRLCRQDGSTLGGEVLQLGRDSLAMMPDAPPDGVSLGDRVVLLGPVGIAPDRSWVGRVIDPYGAPLDGDGLLPGGEDRPLRASPPAPATRRGLGPRLETGMAVFNTLLPIVEGQRIGLFAGSGVGKSSLLAHLACHLDADLVVIALIGERGRELREFVEEVLGAEGMARSIIVAATSDRSPLVRRRCAWTAMAVAEHFRDQGARVLLLADSITRFAEAHREVAAASGELPALRGYPPSTAHVIMELCERAGPGADGAGTITGIFSVLVAGSDMEEPVADILRGVLDGHVVLDRRIAERGRFPAIDLLRSVSRSLPGAATEDENALIAEARQLMGSYQQSEMMIRAGLYTEGSDPALDAAVRAWPELDAFVAETAPQGVAHSFDRLRLILRRARAVQPPVSRGGGQAARLRAGGGRIASSHAGRAMAGPPSDGPPSDGSRTA
ncbi:FliI/YscN family ATPase [Maritimibacter alkaliphilus]|uniref:FliI/YscN family ATPase n=1 Tax=Maritimibacter alkaliphilus TaxID=404236 RepID=UPI001C93C2C7|nr:FliI/YscN family ATPase [Maritimibacter alkaliphilus]MBY6090645.1 FliI/YscN family ATPase [Maritimibacter alkaliphilus]